MCNQGPVQAGKEGRYAKYGTWPCYTTREDEREKKSKEANDTSALTEVKKHSYFVCDEKYKCVQKTIKFF